MERLLRFGLLVFLFFICPYYGMSFFGIAVSDSVTMRKANDNVREVYCPQMFVRALNDNISHNLREYDSILICDNCFSKDNALGIYLDEFPSKISVTTLLNPTIFSDVSLSRYFTNEPIVHRQASYIGTGDYVFMDYVILNIGQTDIMTAITSSYTRSFSILTYYIDGFDSPVLEIRSYNVGFILGGVFLSVTFPLKVTLSFLY